MVDSSLWKDMQINDKLVIDTIRKDSKDTIYFKDKDSRFIWNNTMHAKQFGLDDPNALIGKDGWGFRGFSRKLLKNDLIDFVGSDTHNRTSRACYLDKAYRYVSRKLGADEADRIFIDNPMKIIEAGVQVV